MGTVHAALGTLHATLYALTHMHCIKPPMHFKEESYRATSTGTGCAQRHACRRLHGPAAPAAGAHVLQQSAHVLQQSARAAKRPPQADGPRELRIHASTYLHASMLRVRVRRGGRSLQAGLRRSCSGAHCIALDCILHAAATAEACKACAVQAALYT